MKQFEVSVAKLNRVKQTEDVFSSRKFDYPIHFVYTDVIVVVIKDVPGLASAWHTLKLNDVRYIVT